MQSHKRSQLSTDSYHFVLRKEDLLACHNPIFKELIRDNYLVTSSKVQSVDEGLAQLNGEGSQRARNFSGSRGVRVSGETRESFSEDFLKETFPEGQHEHILKHYSQGPDQLAASSHMLAFGRHDTLDLTKDLFAEDNISEFKEGVNIFREERITYYKVTKLVDLNLLPGNVHSQKKAAVQAIFKPTKNGYEFVSLATNQPAIFYLWRGHRQELEEHCFLLTRRQRFLHQWRSVSTTRKIAAGVAILAGAAAIVLGVFFPPSLVVTIPSIGKFASASLLIYGGTGLAGAALAGHTTDILLPKQHFLRRWHEMGAGPKIAAGIAVVLGVGAVVAGILCPPSLVVTLPLIKWTMGLGSLLGFSGAGLAGITLLGHATHIRGTSLPVKNGQKNPPDTKEKPPLPRSASIDTNAIKNKLGIKPKPKPKPKPKRKTENESSVSRSFVGLKNSFSDLTGPESSDAEENLGLDKEERPVSVDAAKKDPTPEEGTRQVPIILSH
ncbi:MAG TPA: hypothetical protein VLI69_01095 [Gammaproteobacteria bacterium]|nr:hypothetical protein [Gammaproteobacteria bacterium]